MRTRLYTTFVDFTKAFCTANREGLLKVMQKLGCPERFTHMLRQLHDGIIARVTDNDAISKAFAVTSAVKQGYFLVPIIFSLMFSAVLTDSYRDERPGIRNAYRTDGHLNSGRMPAGKRLSTTTVHGLLFTEDSAPPPRYRVRQLQLDYQHEQDGDHSPTVTKHATLYSSLNHCRQPPTQNRGQSCLSRKHTFQQHLNRRRGYPPDLQSQTSLWPTEEIRVESPPPPTE
ncbi:hypothetical protein SprV_0401544600 [Sparganum proliferum]